MELVGKDHRCNISKKSLIILVQKCGLVKIVLTTEQHDSVIIFEH